MKVSVFSSMIEYVKSLYRGAISLLRAVSTSVPYLFNLNPNTLRKEVTEQYPDPVSSKTVDDLPPRTRGQLVNKIELCIGCHDCARICPVQCIEIESEMDPNVRKEWVSVFKIDHSRCVYCGLCTEVCPTSSIVHTKRYEGASVDRIDLIEDFGKGRAPWKVRS